MGLGRRRRRAAPGRLVSPLAPGLRQTVGQRRVAGVVRGRGGGAALAVVARGTHLLVGRVRLLLPVRVRLGRGRGHGRQVVQRGQRVHQRQRRGRGAARAAHRAVRRALHAVTHAHVPAHAHAAHAAHRLLDRFKCIILFAYI